MKVIELEDSSNVFNIVIFKNMSTFNFKVFV